MTAQQFLIFVQCRPGKTKEIALAVIKRRFRYVEQVLSISGKWDLLIRIKISDDKEVESDIIEPLFEGLWDDVIRTKTIIAYNVFDPEDSFIED